MLSGSIVTFLIEIICCKPNGYVPIGDQMM